MEGLNINLNLKLGAHPSSKGICVCHATCLGFTPRLVLPYIAMPFRKHNENMFISIHYQPFQNTPVSFRSKLNRIATLYFLNNKLHPLVYAKHYFVPGLPSSPTHQPIQLPVLPNLSVCKRVSCC